MIKEGCTVIDIGINRVKDEKTGKMKLVGDVDFESKDFVFIIFNFQDVFLC